MKYGLAAIEVDNVRVWVLDMFQVRSAEGVLSLAGIPEEARANRWISSSWA